MPSAKIVIHHPTVEVVQKIVKVSTRGAAGPSAYDAWLSAGHTGDIEDFLDWLITQYGITITAAAGASVPSMAALAAIAAPAVGQTALMYETGRFGWFRTKLYSSISSLVDADVIHALSIRSTSDATKAWERMVPDNIYEATWWEISEAAADNSAALANALFTDLIPQGATFRVPGFEFKTQLPISGERHNLTIVGHGRDVSRLVADPDEDGFCPLTIYGDNLTFRSWGISGNSDPAFANAPPCCHLGLGPTATVYRNWVVDDMAFDDGAIGLICTASNSTTEIARPEGIQISRTRFGTKGQGLSLFGVKDAHVDDCEAKMVDSEPDNSSCGMRILGSEDVWVKNFNGRVSGEYGYYIAGMQRNTGVTTLRLQNKNINVADSNLTNTMVLGIKIRCLDGLSFDNCQFEADIEGETENTGCRIDTGTTIAGIMTEVGRVSITNTKFIGYHQKTYSQGPVKGFLDKGGEWIGNASPTAVGLPGNFYTSNFGSAKLTQLIDTQGLQPSGGHMDGASGQGVSCLNQVGDEIVRGFNNDIPEGCPPTGIFIGQSGTPGTADGDLTNQRVFPDGSYAALTS